MRPRPLLVACLTPLLAIAASATTAAPVDAAFDVEKLEHSAVLALQRSVAELGNTQPVEVDVVDLRAIPDSAAALAVEGVGRLRVAAGQWIPMRFEGGYDVATGELDGLRVQPIANAPRMALPVEDGTQRERVNQQVAARILGEFPEQKLDIVFVDLQPTFEGDAHVAFHGSGVVDFTGEGRAPVAFSAILDRASGLVVALDYELEIAGAHGEATYADGVLASR